MTITRLVCEIERQYLVLYHAFSGKMICIILSSIQDIKGIQDGAKTAFIGIKNGGEACNILSENRENY